MLGGLLGGLVGGILRLAPEAFKLFDRKNERSHELKMTELSIRQLEVQGKMKLDEADIQLQASELASISEAFKEQAITAAASYKWVNAISAMVRPGVTWWLVGLYSAARIAGIHAAFQESGSVFSAVQSTYTSVDFDMLTMVLTFWFVGRVWERNRA